MQPSSSAGRSQKLAILLNGRIDGTLALTSIADIERERRIICEKEAVHHTIG